MQEEAPKEKRPQFSCPLGCGGTYTDGQIKKHLKFCSLYKKADENEKKTFDSVISEAIKRIKENKDAIKEAKRKAKWEEKKKEFKAKQEEETKGEDKKEKSKKIAQSNKRFPSINEREEIARIAKEKLEEIKSEPKEDKKKHVLAKKRLNNNIFERTRLPRLLPDPTGQRNTTQLVSEREVICCGVLVNINELRSHQNSALHKSNFASVPRRIGHRISQSFSKSIPCLCGGHARGRDRDHEQSKIHQEFLKKNDSKMITMLLDLNKIAGKYQKKRQKKMKKGDLESYITKRKNIPPPEHIAFKKDWITRVGPMKLSFDVPVAKPKKAFEGWMPFDTISSYS